MLSMIQVQVQHSFYPQQLFIIISPPPCQPMLSSTTFLLLNFSPPLGSPCFQLQHSFYQNIPPPLAAHAFNDSGYQGSSATLPQNFPPPPLGSPSFQLQHSFYPNSPPPFGSPCFQWFRLPGVICDPTWLPFIKISPPPLGSPCFQLQHSFYQNFPPPLAAHAFNDSGYQGLSATLPDFLLSKFFNPPWQPILSTTTFLLSKFSPPFGSPCFQWFRLPGVICDPTWLPFIKIFTPLGSPCFQLQHSFYQKHSLYQNSPPPFRSPCFQWFRLPGHLRPYLTSFYQKNSPPPPLGSPCFQLQHSFYQNFPPPLWQPTLSMIRVTRGHLRPYLTSFFLYFPPPPPLGSPCFQLQHSFYPKFPPPLWQPMLSMIQVTRGHLRPYLTSFYQIFPPPPLGSPCFQLSTTTFLLSKPPPPLWQPMLSMIQVTRGYLRPYLTSFYHNFPPPEISPHPPKTSHGLLRPYPTSLSM